MRIKPLFSSTILISCLFLTTCTPKAKLVSQADEPFAKDLSGEYRTISVEEFQGQDPLGGNPMTITVEKEDNFYIFTITHREQQISQIKKPYLDREFPGRMQEAKSNYMLSRTPTGLACEVMTDDQTYHFVVLLEKN